MKTEYKKVSELLALENEEVLKEFEMVELKGGNGISPASTNIQCQNKNCDCTPINKDCPISGKDCIPPVIPPFINWTCSLLYPCKNLND